MKKTIHKPTVFIFLFLLIAAVCNAQKLPSVQQNGLRAPVNIKIDGKTTEWDNTFQAYNNATDIFYTLANDDENLYFTVQATDIDIINRIAGGGITLVIPRSGKKNDKDVMTVTYPLIDKKASLVFLRPRKGSIPDTSIRALDSVVRKRNASLNEKVKWIGVTGIAGIDSLISVYNEDGIKVAESFNRSGAYTFEMAISLKKLGLSVDNASKFNYHVISNGAKGAASMSIGPPAANSTPEQVAFIEKMSASMNVYVAKLSAPTDFWGEYTLVKK